MNILATASILTLFLSYAHAAISVLRMDDTVDGFTTTTATLGDNPMEGSSGYPIIGGDPDDLWGFDQDNTQALFGSAGTGTSNLSGYVWGSRMDLGEDSPEFDTVISGLNAGTTYNIYAYIVTSDGGGWVTQLGLNGGGLTSYGRGDGALLEESSTSNFERILIGQVSGLTSATVNIDDGGDRSFIKGIGVEAIPEPSSSILLAVGAIALALRRRK